MKKKKLIILIIAIISFVIAGSSVFAYFYISSKKANELRGKLTDYFDKREPNYYKHG